MNRGISSKLHVSDKPISKQSYLYQLGFRWSIRMFGEWTAENLADRIIKNKSLGYPAYRSDFTIVDRVPFPKSSRVSNFRWYYGSQEWRPVSDHRTLYYHLVFRNENDRMIALMLA